MRNFLNGLNQDNSCGGNELSHVYISVHLNLNLNLEMQKMIK
jgi:hypothetical protein